MKIIIDISDEDYQMLNSREEIITLSCNIIDVIRNGTPLPEHHGRLGDLDKLYTEMNNGIKAGNYEDGYESYGHINDMDDCLECVKYADTIIEAS